MLGAPLESARALRADVSVEERGARRYQLALRVENADTRAERELSLHSCGEVERAVVLIVTTALQMEALGATDLGATTLTEVPGEADDEDPLDEPPARAVTPPPEPEPEPAPAEPEPSAAVDAAPATPPSPPGWWLRIGAVLDLAALPSPTLGPVVGVGLHRRRFRVWMGGRYFVPRERTDRGSGQLTEIGMYTAALGGSLAFALGRFALGPVAELELGLLHARVLGEAADGTARAAWVAALAGGHAEVTVRTGVALALDVLLGVPLRRSGFVVEDLPSFYRTKPLTARFALGVRVHLGP